MCPGWLHPRSSRARPWPPRSEAAIMARVSLAVCCCAALAGCQGLPDRPALAPPPKPRHTVSLFEESEPDNEALRRVVLRHVPPGTPVDQARSALEGQGFICQAADGKSPFWHEGLVPQGVYLPFAVETRLRHLRDC